MASGKLYSKCFKEYMSGLKHTRPNYLDSIKLEANEAIANKTHSN